MKKSGGVNTLLTLVIDGGPVAGHFSPQMQDAEFSLGDGRRRVVGSIGGADALARIGAEEAAAACDVVEIRLDTLVAAGAPVVARGWAHLRGLPLLFTARRADQGGAGNLNAAGRSALVEAAIGDAAAVDLEVASLAEMADLRARLGACGVPWIGSFHDFSGMPAEAVLEEAARRALEAGAAAFKAAVRITGPEDLSRLAGFQLADHGLPVATMGMGPLAAVSRLLCGQCGSVLNYGFLGGTATAPGQWDAGFLRLAMARLESIGGGGL